MCTILYWSPYHGQGQTSNLHATALIMSMLYKKKILLMQTHFAKNNLEGPLVGININRTYSAEDELFQDIGLDVAVTFTNMDKLNYSVLESCCFTFPETSLLLLPGTQTRNLDTFHWDIGKSVDRMIKNASQCVDLILVDANSGDDKLSFQLMEKTDLIVVNLTQRRYVLDNFFETYGDYFKQKNVFYLFGDYDDNSSYNITNCRLKYRKYINRNNSGIIPYCTRYMDAQNESDVIRFMEEGIHKSEKAKHYRRYFSSKGGTNRQEESDFFFLHAKAAVDKILTTIPTTNLSYQGKGRSIRV